MTMKAHYMRNLEGWTGDARLYTLDPALEYKDGDGAVRTQYVIVSGITGIITETYIFPASFDGEALSFSELEGSFSGAVDHERALNGLGYSVA